jgi:glutamine---fructose-6-phosphate transaminase (isomerizing)
VAGGSPGVIGVGDRAGRDRVDALLEDVLAGPDELARVIDACSRAVAAIPDDVFGRRRWRFLGMGSSGYASLDAATRLRAAGLDAAAEPPAGSVATSAGHDVVCVAVSSSGRTRETIAAADRHRGTSFVIGVTSDPAAPLAGRVDALLPLVGERRETAGIATTSFRATVAALAMLADRAAGDQPGIGLPAAVPILASVIGARDGWLAGAADVLDVERPVHVLGDGSRIGVALQAALMLREAPRIAATAFDTADWLHTGVYTLYPGDAVLLLGGSPADDEAVEAIHARGGRIVSTGPAPADPGQSDVHVALPDAASADPGIRSLVEPVLAELLSVELWRRAQATLIGEVP